MSFGISNARFRFRMPTGNAGQQTPTWNAGSIQSVNIQSDSIQDGDQLFYDDNRKLWVTGNIPAFAAATGSVTSPSYSFEGSTGTGMYLAGPDSLGLAAGAEPVAEISPTGFNVSVQIQAATGVVGAPEYSFTSDPNTGIYLIGADNIGFSTGGVLRMDIDTTDITSTLPHVYPYATAAGTDAGVTIPDGTQVFKLTTGTETGAYALTAPAGVAGQILYVRNDSSQATTGLVVPAGAGATFAHDGTSFVNVSG